MFVGVLIVLMRKGDNGLLRRGVFGSDEEDLGAIGHLQNIGHVASGRDVENGMTDPLTLKDIEDLCPQDARVNGQGLAGLEPDLHLILAGKASDEANEGLAVVIRLRDPMAASQIELSDLFAGEEVAEILFNYSNSRNQIGYRLLAKSVNCLLYTSPSPRD